MLPTTPVERNRSQSRSNNSPVPAIQKQTLQSTGIWERIRRAFAIDPNRSNGVPLNPYFRNPAPGELDPSTYDDPVTIPAGDIADNPYWRRDARRAYPRPSTIAQTDVVGLLALGNSVNPKKELIGEAGAKELVAVKEEAEQGGLAVFFQKGGEGGAAALEGLKAFGRDGMPPVPSSMKLRKEGDKWEAAKYELTEEQSYGGE